MYVVRIFRCVDEKVKAHGSARGIFSLYAFCVRLRDKALYGTVREGGGG